MCCPDFVEQLKHLHIKSFICKKERTHFNFQIRFLLK